MSYVGTGVSGVALPLLVLSLTGSPAQAGIVAGLERFPYLVLALVAGVFVDRWDRKRILIISDGGRAVALAGVAAAILFHRLSVVQLYAVALIEGTLFTFFNVAEAASLSSLVEPEQIPAGFALRETAWSGSGIIAPALGGVLYGTARFLPFAADAVSYCISAASLVGVKRPLRGESDRQSSDVLEELLTGVKWLLVHRAVLLLTLLSGGLDFVIEGTALVVILLAHGRHASAAAIGLMLSIGSVGPILGYVIAPRIQGRFSLATILPTALWLEALLWTLYLVAPNSAAIGLILALTGCVASVYIVADVGYRMGSVPTELQGRLNSVFGLLPFGLQSISLTIGGVISQALGPEAATAVFTACLASMALVATLSQALRLAPRI